MTMPKDEKPPNNDDHSTISSSTEAAYRQYDRLAEDWRLHTGLIWQIPSVAVAIIGGILTVSYSFLVDIPRVVLLSIGSILMLALTIALAKHRLGAEARSQFLMDLETETFKIKQFPIKSDGIKHYLNDKSLTHDRLFYFLIKHSSEIWLLRVMFAIFMVMSVLVAWEFIHMLLQNLSYEY